MNIACYSAFGNEEKTLSGISIQDVDKKGVEFSEVIPLNSDIRKVEVYFSQCLLTDGTTLKVKERRIVENSFVPFEKEDRAAAQRLLPNANGYPLEKGTHWFCACGAVYSSERENCIKCGKSKQEIFSVIVTEKLEEEKTEELKKHKVKRIVIGSFVFALGFISLIAIFLPVLVRGIIVLLPELQRREIDEMALIAYFLVQFLFSVVVILIGILLIISIRKKSIKISDKKAKKLSIGVSITCLILMFIYLISADLIGFYGILFTDLYWLGFVLGSIIFICFMIYLKFNNRIYDYFNNKVKKKD